jgi:transposase
MGKDNKDGELSTIGLDLGDEWSQYCRLDGKGEVMEEGKVRTTESGLSEVFGRLPKSCVAMETGTHSPWVERVLSANCRHKTIVANPRRLRLIFQSTNKTDRLDAQALARVARMDPNLLYPIQHRGEKAQADLAVLRARGALVEARSKLVNAVRGMLKSFGKRVKKCSTDAFAKAVAGAIPEEMTAAIDPMVETIKTLSEKIAGYDRTVDALAKKYPETKVLREIPGVGPVTSMTYVLTLEDPGRFRNARSVGAFLGLTARRAQSSGEDPQLRITKAGDATTRSLLVGSAQYILGPFGPDTDLRRWGLKLAERGAKNQKKRAVVAVARKLAVLLHRLWVTQQSYDPLRNARRTEALQRSETAKEKPETAPMKR